MAAISTISTVATVVGTAFSALGAIQQGRQAEAQAQYNAQIQNRNAEIARQQAERERQIAEANEEDFRKEQRRLEARRRAQMAGSGVDIGTGTPLLQSSDIASEIELQALRIRNSGAAESTRLRQQADIFDRQAGLTRRAGRNARRAGLVRGGSLLIRGAGEAAPLFEG